MGDQGDEDFTAFVAERAHALLRAAYALTGNQHAAEDLVQTAFAKAYARWHRLSDEPEPYVRKMIYHDFVSSWRRRRGEVTVADPPEHRAPDAAQDDAAHERLMLRAALGALPPRQRAVIVLRYLEDRSLAETAAILGCSQGTVASQTNRALVKLRELVPTFDPADAAPTAGQAATPPTRRQEAPRQ